MSTSKSMSSSNLGVTTPSQSMSFGPVTVLWTPGTTNGNPSCFVQIQLQQSIVSSYNLTNQDSQLRWNTKVGQTTSAGTIVFQAASGTALNILTANSITWDSPNTGPQTSGGQIASWANS